MKIIEMPMKTLAVNMKKIDRSRFEKMYKDSIKNLVEDEIHQKYYAEPQTKYTCTVNFYKKWKDK